MHKSENTTPLQSGIERKSLNGQQLSLEPNVWLFLLPYFQNISEIPRRRTLYKDLNHLIKDINNDSTIIILSSPIFAVDFSCQLSDDVNLKLWISVKLREPPTKNNLLDQQHAALLIFTKNKENLKHSKTQIGYSFCPACDRTTKDYGGKKHLYDKFGTLMSDVWRDLAIDLDEYPLEIVDRIRDLFGVEPYKLLNVIDLRDDYKITNHMRITVSDNASDLNAVLKNNDSIKSKLVLGDCLDKLRSIPSNSIDFCFADPPYNIKKKYDNWNDNVDILEYFKWCDLWLSELGRVLKPNRTCAILNIPQWCVRHYKHLNDFLLFQDWICWEALSLPVRKIMPAHYGILCMSKGEPRPLPGMVRNSHSFLETQSLNSSKEFYCARSSCVKNRRASGIDDSQEISNLWWDIHRLKHNSRRVDHPTQLPSKFMLRMISLFTNKEEVVLDPFNGAGTTSLSAEMLDRNYIGIEISSEYHKMAEKRHEEFKLGIDPFRKINRIPNSKNSRVARLKKQKYAVSKKILQLEVKEISIDLGRLPSREDLIEYSKYPIEFFDNYFIDWGEVCAAARTTGMSEYKVTPVWKIKDGNQGNFFSE